MMYNAHFQFREAPFGVTPDPQFYYSNAIYREALATLCYGIESRKGFIVLAGEVGTGKTTLLRKAMRSFGSNIKVAYICNTLVSFTELLRLILNDLGLPTNSEDKLSMMGQLNEYLLEQLIAGNIVALLIDEAQDLGPEILEELRLLSNLETDKDKLLQIVLIGQPELERKLDQANLRQLKQRVALRCRLNPIGADEVGAYIHSRLQTIGHKGEDLFDSEAVQKIAASSKGIPRLINVICDNALLTAYAMSEFRVRASMIDEVSDDLRIGETRATREICNPKSNARDEQEAALPTGLRRQVDLMMTQQPDSNDTGNFRGSMDRPRRAFRNYGNSQQLATGALLAVLMLTVLAALAYSQKGIPVVVDLPRRGNADIVNGREEIKHRKLPISIAPQNRSPRSRPIEVSLAVKPSNANDTEKKSLPAGAGTVRRADPPAARAPVVPLQVAANNLTPQKIVRRLVLADDPAENSGPRGDNREKASSTGDFDVVAASFVRGRPTSNADIIATLQPGSHINVFGRTGDYYQVRTLGNKTIHGYVHREDAFFAKLK
jgi:type II secretory pathway predicted ATPase ExeA